MCFHQKHLLKYFVPMSKKLIPELDIRKAIASHLSECCDVMDDYTFADILYSVLRKVKPASISVSWVRDVSDDRIFSVVDGLIAEEEELRKERKKK